MPLNCPGVTIVFCLECIFPDFLVYIHINCPYLQNRETVCVLSVHAQTTTWFVHPTTSPQHLPALAHKAPAHVLPLFAIPESDLAHSLPYSRAVRLPPNLPVWKRGSMPPCLWPLVHTHEGLCRACLQKESWGSWCVPFLCGSRSRQLLSRSMYQGLHPLWLLHFNLSLIKMRASI